MRSKRPWVIASAMAFIFGLSACGSSGSGSGASPFPSLPVSTSPEITAPVPGASPSSSAPTSAAPASAAPTSAAPTAPTPSASPTHVGLAVGDQGPKVLALQKRLVQLGFWVSATDGSFGETTQQAVLAVQKATGLGRDGVAGPLTVRAVERGVTIRPRSTAGHWLEIDKSKQLLLIVTDGKVDTVLNTSTGSGLAYQQGGQTYTATTPSGQFAIFRQVDHDDPGPLGDLWRPKYFNGGIAIHGAPVVPAYPASHGCARLSNAAIDWIWSEGLAPIGTKIWVY